MSSSNFSVVFMPIWTSQQALWGSHFLTLTAHSIPSGRASWVITWQWCRWMLLLCPGLLITGQEDHNMCVLNIVCLIRWWAPHLFILYTTDFSHCTETCHLQMISDNSAKGEFISGDDETEHQAVVHSLSRGGSRIIGSSTWQRPRKWLWTLGGPGNLFQSSESMSWHYQGCWQCQTTEYHSELVQWNVGNMDYPGASFFHFNFWSLWIQPFQWLRAAWFFHH